MDNYSTRTCSLKKVKSGDKLVAGEQFSINLIRNTQPVD